MVILSNPRNVNCVSLRREPSDGISYNFLMSRELGAASSLASQAFTNLVRRLLSFSLAGLDSSIREDFEVKKIIPALVMAAAFMGAMAPAQAGDTCKLFGFCPSDPGTGGDGGGSPTSVPEPTTLALLGAGAVAVLAARRRKK